MVCLLYRLLVGKLDISSDCFFFPITLRTVVFEGSAIIFCSRQIYIAQASQLPAPLTQHQEFQSLLQQCFTVLNFYSSTVLLYVHCCRAAISSLTNCPCQTGTQFVIEKQAFTDQPQGDYQRNVVQPSVVFNKNTICTCVNSNAMKVVTL